MSNKISSGLKTLFLINFIIAGIFGVQHLLAPRLWTDLAGMEIMETVTWRVIGAALIGFAVSSWMGYRETEWRSVRILVVMQVVWSILGALVILWGIIFEGLAPLEWLNVVTLAGFALAFTIFWFRNRK